MRGLAVGVTGPEYGLQYWANHEYNEWGCCIDADLCIVMEIDSYPDACIDLQLATGQIYIGLKNSKL